MMKITDKKCSWRVLWEKRIKIQSNPASNTPTTSPYLISWTERPGPSQLLFDYWLNSNTNIPNSSQTHLSISAVDYPLGPAPSLMYSTRLKIYTVWSLRLKWENYQAILLKAWKYIIFRRLGRWLLRCLKWILSMLGMYSTNYGLNMWRSTS